MLELMNTPIPPLTSNPDLIAAADIIRVLCILAAAVLTGLVIGLYRKRPKMNPYQRARFFSLMVVSFVVGGSQYERMGAPISYLLPAFVVFLAAAIYGVWGVHSGREHLGAPCRHPKENP